MFLMLAQYLFLSVPSSAIPQPSVIKSYSLLYHIVTLKYQVMT